MRTRPTRTASRSAANATRFDAGYYRRYYKHPATRVADARAVQRLAAFVKSYLDYLDLPVRSVLDVGCGLGHWRNEVRTHWPRARYYGVEFSEHLCAQFGWTRGSIVDLDPASTFGRAHFDLVVCQGVLQYLDDQSAARAIDNLGRWTRGALYLEALTDLDWRCNVDRRRTDGDVHRRPGAWYRRRLNRHFLNAGGGVFPHRGAGVTLFELEGA